MLAAVAYGFHRCWRLWWQGKAKKRQHQFWRGAADVITFAFGHARIAREPYPGTMHVFIFWGAVLLFFATSIVAPQADLSRQAGDQVRVLDKAEILRADGEFGG